MRYHTTDLGERAMSIAHKEAEKRCREAWDYSEYFKIWLKIFEQTLREFAPQC